MSKTRRPKELITEPSVGEIWSSGRTSPNFQQQFPLTAPVPVRSLSNPVPPSPPFIIPDRKTSLASSISSTTSSGWGHSPERIETLTPTMPRKESASSISNSQRSALYLEPENINALFASAAKTKNNKLTLAGPPRRSSDLEPPQRSPSPLHTPGSSPTGTFGHTRRKKSREEKEPSFLASLFGSRPASPSLDISAQTTSNNHYNTNSSKTVKSSGFNSNSNSNGTNETHSHGHARKMSAGNAVVLGLPEDDGQRRKSFDSYRPNDTTNYGYCPPSEMTQFAYQVTAESLSDLHKAKMATISSSVELQPSSHRRHGLHKRTNSSDSEQIQMGLDNGSSLTLASTHTITPPVKEKKAGFLNRFKNGKKKKSDNERTPEVILHKHYDSESIRHGVSALNTPINEKDDYFSPNLLPSSSSVRSNKSDHHYYNHWGRIKRRESFKEKKNNATTGYDLDLNLTDMEGILNYNFDAASNFNGSFDDYNHKDFQSYVTDFKEFPPGGKNETWLPPDSWAVLKPSEFGIRLDDGEEDQVSNGQFVFFIFFADDLICVFQISLDKQFCIRIFRPDATFGTVSCGLNTTTAELCQMLGRKFFIQDISKYNLYVKRNNLERVLAPQERPLQLQKKWLEQVGYSESDRLEDLGREDNSYLVRFTYRQATMPTRTEEEENRASYKHVDLQARNLQTIPIFLHKYAYTILSLDVSQNLLIDLPTDFIQSCTQLRELYLAQNDFERVPQSVLDAEMLSKLTLSSNRLRDLEHVRLDSLKSLNNLQVENNLLKTLPEYFARMSSLSILNLSNNSFKSFPETLFQIYSLQELDMSFNQIGLIPEEIGNLSSLECLLVVGNQITGALPASFAKLVKLRYLNLCHNMIHNIEVLSNCPRLQQLYVESNSVSIVDISANSLQELYLSRNHLTQFSLMGTGLTLTTLCLTHSKLTTLPDTLFEHLLVVERLELCYNQLVSLPSTISTLQRLIHFNCTNNLLTELPPEIGRLCSLHSLDVHINNISKLPKEIWLCQNLVSFNASSNLLKYFPSPYMEITSTSTIPLSPSTVTLVAPTFGTINASTTTLCTLSNSSHVDSSAKSGPPLASSLRALFLGDNQLRNDVFAVISVFTELRILNLAFNYLDEFPKCSLMSSHLTELYLSGNEFGALPDEIDQLTSLRVLHVNGNKLQTLPAELSKIRKLLVLDVGSNALKYNIANWQFDWNWNWNIELKYLNLSGNKRFEIKPNHLHEVKKMQDRNLAAFDSLSRLRVLGLMDVTLLNLSVPDDSEDRRVRTSGSEVNSMAYGMADTLGQLEHLSTWEAVVPKFNNREDECLFGLFDSRVGSNQGGRVTKYLHDWFPFHFSSELKKLRDNNDTIESALRRSFLSLNKELGAKVFNSNLEMNLDFQREKNAASNLGIDDNKSGASGLIAYIKGTTLYVANVGDIVAVISRNRGNASPIAQKHSPMTPSEIARIRNAGGFISHKRLVNGELEVSRSFGHFHLIPAINANPTVEIVHLEEQDEFIIIATRGLWDRISYQTAVDIAYNEYTERGDLMRAAQKLRDFAIAYGAEDSIMVMIVGVEDIFGRGTRKWESKGTDNSNNIVGNTYYIRARRRDEDKPSDSTIARLQKEIEPPTGKIALVFTDIKNSTFLWETIPIAMRHAIKSHNSIMRRQLRNIGGYEVKTEGDAFMVSFPTVSSALLWCFTVQMQLLRADWPNELLELVDGKEVYGGHDSDLIYRGLSVRMGIHWGSPVCEIDPITKRMDYFGPMVNRAARICNAADGGQICVSADVESEIRLLEAMIDNDPTMGTSRKNSQDAEGEYEVAAAAAAALESNGRVEGPPSLSSNSGIDKTILSLRKMGFVVRKIGETKLKGLENPEELSLIYPEPLKGRLEEDQKKANQRSSVITPEKIYEPSTQILDPSSIRALGYLCLRLERVASGYVNTRRTRNSRTDYLTGLLTFHVKDNADDEELLRITESLITRIENAISTLALKKVGAYSKVLDTIITDPELVSKALQMCIQILGASK